MPEASTATKAGVPAGIQAVIEAFDEIVKPDGGSVSFLSVDECVLRVAYAKGVNEQCVECIMEPDALAGMMKDMLVDQAPQILEVTVELAR